VLTEPLIKTEGLFRVSARQQTVEILREAYDRGQKFIVWSEGDRHVSFPHFKEGHGDVSVDPEDLAIVDGYDVHTAAALIKLWYKELREPIFPQSSYQALDSYYGKPDTILDVAVLLGILDPGVEYSPVQEIARKILVTHLLPLLSLVSSYSETNKMTPSNLAVCFAPILLYGPDPLADVKIMAIIRRLLTAMIEHWATDLAPALGSTEAVFRQTLQLPEKPEDREDPLEEVLNPSSESNHQQISGITLLDNDNNVVSLSGADHLQHDNDGNKEGAGPTSPALPPRPQRAATVATASIASTSSIAETDITDHNTITAAVAAPTAAPIFRKPAPPLNTPPRYSSLQPSEQAAAALDRIFHNRRDRPTGTVEINDSPIEASGSGRGRASFDTLPLYEETSGPQSPESHSSPGQSAEADRSVSGMTIPRKPVAKGEKG
jgi:Rho GTPase-activating protein 1